MKKFIYILILIVYSKSLLAQEDIVLNYQNVDHKTIHFGFTIGFNTMDFDIKPTMNSFGVDSTVLIPEINNLAPGFHVGIVSDLKLTDNLSLRFLPGISLGTRRIVFYDNEQNVVSEWKPIESTFIDLPLLLKYKATRINNTRPYLIGGVNVRNDMARNKEFNEDDEIYIKLKPFDIYYEIGVGIDFYLTYFKFSTEIKYSVGTFNIVSSDASEDYPQYANSIDTMKSRLFLISFHFE